MVGEEDLDVSAISSTTIRHNWVEVNLILEISDKEKLKATLWIVTFCITVVTQRSSKVNSDWLNCKEMAVRTIRAIKSVSYERKKVVSHFSAQRGKGWQWTQLIQAGVGLKSQGGRRAIKPNSKVDKIKSKYKLALPKFRMKTEGFWPPKETRAVFPWK